MSKKIYDVSMKISENMPVWKGYQHKYPKLTSVSSMKKGDSVNETHLSINIHTGTHMDFPLHVGGNITSSSLDLNRLVRNVKVLDLTNLNKKEIDENDLRPFNLQKGDAVLIKTLSSPMLNFDADFVFLNQSGATFLAKIGVNLVGVEALGVERDRPNHPTHHALMDNGIYLLEGLVLSDVKEGEYKMYALPLKIDNIDGLLLSVILEDL